MSTYSKFVPIHLDFLPDRNVLHLCAYVTAEYSSLCARRNIRLGNGILKIEFEASWNMTIYECS